MAKAAFDRLRGPDLRLAKLLLKRRLVARIRPPRRAVIARSRPTVSVTHTVSSSPPGDDGGGGADDGGGGSSDPPGPRWITVARCDRDREALAGGAS